MRFSVSSSCDCKARKFWFDLRSGYFSETASSLPSAPESWPCTSWNFLKASGLVRISGGICICVAFARDTPGRPRAPRLAGVKWLNQYQRRTDLIPNLVETVKGYAAQESKVLTEVTEARAKATQVQIPPDILTDPEAFQKFQEAQGVLTGALSR